VEKNKAKTATCSLDNISMLNGGKRDLAKHVKTIKENVC
jgi:hypothetical protein